MPEQKLDPAKKAETNSVQPLSDEKILVPSTEKEAAKIIKRAANNRHRILCIGFGNSLDRIPRDYDHLLSSRAFDQLVFYEPDETVIRFGAGTPLRKVEELLQAHNQILPFDPPNLATNNPDETIGGIVAMALAGPQSASRGGVKDHLLGCRFINGRGEVLNVGSRVIKNVTGYDVAKLLCGSWGRLGFMTEVTLRTAAQPSTSATFSFSCDQMSSLDIIGRSFGSAYAPTATSWLDQQCAQKIGLGKQATLIMRFSGFDRQTQHSVLRAQDLASEHRSTELNIRWHRDSDEVALWQQIKNLSFYDDIISDNTALWRITLPLSCTLALVQTAPKIASHIMIDGAGQRVWMQTHRDHDNLRKLVTQVAPDDGKAFLFRYPKDRKTSTLANLHLLETAHPRPSLVKELEDRVIRAFDPSAIFSPLP